MKKKKITKKKHIRKAGLIDGVVASVPPRLNTRQTSSFTGVAYDTLVGWRAQKNPKAPPYMKLGGRVVYDRAALEAWMQENTRETRAS